MTYEEKLQKIIGKLKEERDLTRKGHKSKVILDDNSFTKVGIREICKILLQLQDDEHIVKILDALQPLETVPTEQIINPSDNDDYEGVEVITIEFGEEFDEWYANYLIQQKSSPENLDWLNFLKIFDVCSDISQQLQITGNTTITIPSFPYPYIGRFVELFPYDSIGTRKNYQQHRWEGSQYLLRYGVVLEVREQSDDILGYGNIEIKIDLLKFDVFYRIIDEEFTKRKKSFDNKSGQPEKLTGINITTDVATIWPDNFRWEGKEFIFGSYGSIGFTSENRKHILKVLTDKKGSWATIRELQGSKDAGYVRSTIKHIEDRLPEEAKTHISIISTQDDNSQEKPNMGAYRLKIY